MRMYEEVDAFGMTIRLVPIDKVSIASTNMRSMRDEKIIEQLSKNIQQLEELGVQIGLLNPPLATTKNEIFAGGYRLQAYKKAGKVVIPLRILDIPEDLQIIFSLSEGMHQSLDRFDVGRGIKRLREINKSKWTYAKIAKALGLSDERSLYDIATIDKIEPGFLDKIKSHPKKFSVHEIKQLHKIKKELGIDKKQEDYLINSLQDVTTDKIDNLAKWASEGIPIDLDKEKQMAEKRRDYISIELKVNRLLYSRIRDYCIRHSIDPEVFMWKAAEEYLERHEKDD